MVMDLPKDVLYILDRISACGGSAHVVGGAVRDMLLGRPIGDYDITTSLTPDAVKATFPGHKILDTGIKHGTVTLVLDGRPYEITTYRTDGDYLDSRHPETVNFTPCLGEDLARRDLTVNAMCYDVENGLIDLYGGEADIAARIIRTVGEPHRRFTEDALRILRALRFASVLDFCIEEQTAAAVHELGHTLSRVSRERIMTEWMKLVGGVGAHRIIGEYGDVISVFLPALDKSVLPRVEKFTAAEPMTRIVSLFLKVENGSRAFDESCRALRTDNQMRTLGSRALEAAASGGLDTLRGIRLAMSHFGDDAVVLAVKALAVCEAVSECTIELAAQANALPHRISDLAIGGDELRKIGYNGTAIGVELRALLEDVIFERIDNSPDALIHAAEHRLAKGE